MLSRKFYSRIIPRAIMLSLISLPTGSFFPAKNTTVTTHSTCLLCSVYKQTTSGSPPCDRVRFILRLEHPTSRSLTLPSSRRPCESHFTSRASLLPRLRLPVYESQIALAVLLTNLATELREGKRHTLPSMLINPQSETTPTTDPKSIICCAPAV